MEKICKIENKDESFSSFDVPSEITEKMKKQLKQNKKKSEFEFKKQQFKNKTQKVPKSKRNNLSLEYLASLGYNYESEDESTGSNSVSSSDNPDSHLDNKINANKCAIPSNKTHLTETNTIKEKGIIWDAKLLEKIQSCFEKVKSEKKEPQKQILKPKKEISQNNISHKSHSYFSETINLCEFSENKTTEKNKSGNKKMKTNNIESEVGLIKESEKSKRYTCLEDYIILCFKNKGGKNWSEDCKSALGFERNDSSISNRFLRLKRLGWFECMRLGAFVESDIDNAGNQCCIFEKQKTIQCVIPAIEKNVIKFDEIIERFPFFKEPMNLLWKKLKDPKDILESKKIIEDRKYILESKRKLLLEYLEKLGIGEHEDFVEKMLSETVRGFGFYVSKKKIRKSKNKNE